MERLLDHALENEDKNLNLGANNFESSFLRILYFSSIIEITPVRIKYKIFNCTFCNIKKYFRA